MINFLSARDYRFIILDLTVYNIDEKRKTYKISL